MSRIYFDNVVARGVDENNDKIVQKIVDMDVECLFLMVDHGKTGERCRITEPVQQYRISDLRLEFELERGSIDEEDGNSNGQ